MLIETRQNRRDFIKIAAMAGLATSFAACVSPSSKLTGQARSSLYKTAPLDKVRIAYVGVGGQGTSHVRNLIRIKGAEIVAICDIVEGKVKRSQKLCEEAGQPIPDGYFKDEIDYKRMCERDDIDLVYTATPWKLHVPVCVEAMKTGKHAATEVPAAVTLDECWQLVEVAEKTGKHMVMMENCCYDRTELLVLNMVRKGILGELLHARCGYLHDLRSLKLSPTAYEKMWRLDHSIARNGDLYPTHGLGPIAQCFNINRGNQFDYLVSMSTSAKGLNLYAEKELGLDHKLTKQEYALGDVVSTLIRTVQGQTILITHDTNSPRPYSRDVLVQGTKGIVRKYPEQKIHIEGTSPGHGWESLGEYFDEWEHPLWSSMQEISKGAGHGGMDFIEDYRLIQGLLNGDPMDMDVYDAAMLSAVSAISEQSIAAKGKPIDFPDFTRGLWKTNPELGIVQI
jgi:predicted dehydrogenase